VNSARAAALRCSRLVHELYGEGEKGVDEPRCRARPRNEGERRRASAALHRERKGKWEGSSVGGATWTKEDGMGEGEPGSRRRADRCHSARKQGNEAVCVGCA
jgi:hypothetical protein